MRLLHVYSGNLYGGIEAILVALARHRAACPELESEVALCFEGRLGRELTASGILVHQLGEVRVSRPQTVGRARRRLGALLTSRRFDRVICHAAWAQAIFGPVVHRREVPLVFWVHDVLTGHSWTERWAKRTPPELAICNSRFTAASVASLYREVPRAVVYAPVATIANRLSPAERHAVRAELGTPADAVVIVHASRLEPWKGHAELLGALGQLRDRPSWVCWQLGGPQRPREASYLDSLRDLARRLGITDRVRFAGERTDLPRLLRAADIHCQPNTSPEPFGIVFIEALGAGLPVVTTAIGGALEIVDDSCGRLLPSGDPAAIAATLGQLIDNPVLREQLGSAAPGRAQRLCDPVSGMRHLFEILASIADVEVEA
jgi:glycosyltransferase involved in cell wall biosynthesis